MAGRLGLDPLFQQPEDDEDFETFFQKTLESQKNEYVSPQERKDYFDKIGLGQLDGDTDLKLELYEAPRSRIEQVLKERQANNNQNLAKPPGPSLFSSPIIDLNLAKRGFQSTAIGKMLMGEDTQPAPQPQNDPLTLTPLGPSPAPQAYTRTTPGAPPDLSKELGDMRQVFKETAKPPAPPVKTKMIGTPPEEKAQEPSFLDKAMSYLPFGGFLQSDEVQQQRANEATLTPAIAPATDKPFWSDAYEVGRQAAAGFGVDVPRMGGQVLRAISDEGTPDDKLGKAIVAWSDLEAEGWKPELEGRGAIAETFIKGARAIGPSVSTMLAYMNPYGAFLGPLATVAFFGGSSYQDTHDKVKAAGGSDEDARNAGLFSATIESGGELLSNFLQLRMLGAGKDVTKEFLRGLAEKSTVRPWLKATGSALVGETATEAGQGVGVGAVEQAYGVPTPSLWEIGKESAQAALGMTSLLSVFGLHGHYRNAQRAKAIDTILTNPDVVEPAVRENVVKMLHDEAKSIDVPDADAWLKGALQDVHNQQPIRRTTGMAPQEDSALIETPSPSAPTDIVTDEGVPSSDPTTSALPSDTVASEGTSSPIAPEDLTIPDVVELSSAVDAIGEGLPPVDLPATENNLVAFEGQQTTPEVQGPPQAEALQEEGPITEEQILSALGASFPQEAQPKLIKQPQPVAEEVINEVQVPEPQAVEPSKPLGKRAQAQADLEAKTQLAGLYDTFRYADAMDDQETMQQVAEQLQAQGKDLPDPEQFEQWADIRDTLNAAKNSLGIAGKERGFKALTEVEGQGGTQEVQASRSPTDAWYKELTTNPAPSKYLAEGQKGWNKEKIDRTIEEGLRLLPGEAPSANLQVLLDAIQSDPKYSQLLVAEPDAEYAHRGLFDEAIQGDIFHQEELTPDEPKAEIASEPKAESAKAEHPQKKQLWEMTALEYAQSKVPGATKPGHMKDQHRVEVKAAISRGESVPPNVLAEYQDLQPAPPPQQETNTPTPSMFEQESDDFALTPLAAAPKPQPKPKAEPQPELFSAGEGLEAGVSPIIGREVTMEEAPLFSKTAQEEEPQQSLMPFNIKEEDSPYHDQPIDAMSAERKDRARLADIEKGMATKKPWYDKERLDRTTTMNQRIKEDDAPYQGKPTSPQFFSQLAKTLEQKMPNAASPEQILGIIRNSQTKPEELEWSGLEEFLADKPKATKAEVMEFVKGDMVEVKEVTKEAKAEELYTEDNVRPVQDDAEFGGLADDFWMFSAPGQVFQISKKKYPDQGEAKQYIIREKQPAPKDDTKFSQYTLPGGTNYREHLLTLPEKDYEIPEPELKKNEKGKWAWFADGKQITGAFEDKTDAEWQRPMQRDLQRKAKAQENFTSHHFDEPNIVAHTRTTDRTGPNGEKILFVEEVQSDWHQQGKKRGYRDGTPANNSLGEFMGQPVEASDSRVPQAPFKKTWHELAMKKMLMKAVGEGYDSISWITGEETAKRYDLSQQVDGVRLSGDFDQGIEVSVAKPGEGYTHLTTTTPDKLADVVGKDIAEKALKGGQREFTGLDLKIGGEWAKNLYDKMIPQFMQKLTKKWGGKVETVQIGASDNEFDDISVGDMAAEGGQRTRDADSRFYVTPDGTGGYQVFDGDDYGGMPIQEFDTEAEASQFVRHLEYKEGTMAEGVTIHSLTITDAMRDSLMREGVALFEKEQPYGTRIPAEEGRDRPVQRGASATEEPVGARTPPGRPQPRRAISPLREGGGVRTIGKRLTQELARVGKLDLRGATVRNTQELAELAQIYRNPQYETLRVWYVKDGKVVGHEGLTSRLPNVVSFAKNSATIQNYIDRIAKLNKRFKADGYYLQHNHPSGDPTASKEDKNMTALLADQVLGMQGHVIINHGKYAVLTAKDAVGLPGTPPGTEILEKMHPIDNKNFRADPHKAHPFLGANATDYQMIAEMGKRLQAPKGYTTVIYRGAQGRVEAIQEVPDNMVRSEDFAGYIRNSTRDFGAVSAFTYSTAEDADLELRTMELVEQGVLRDALTDGRDGLKLATEFVRPATGNKNLSQGISTTKAFQRTQKVMEDDAEYTSKADKPSANAFADLERQDKQIERKEVKAGRAIYKEMNRQLREEDKTAWEQGKTWLKRQFSPGGLLPENVFKEKIQRDAQFAVIEFDVEHLIGQLERTIAKDYKSKAKKLDETTQGLLSQVLNGEMPANVPENTKAALLGMRQYIDRLSSQYAGILESQVDDIKKEVAGLQQEVFAIKRKRNAAMMQKYTQSDTIKRNERKAFVKDLQEKVGLMQAKQHDMNAKTATIATIQENIGEYVNRSYKAFDDPQWSKQVPDAVLDAARDHLTERYIGQGLEEQEAVRKSDVVINEILKHGTAYESMEGMIHESKLGAKDLSIFMHRKKIAEPIRALLGEYKDPRVNFAKTSTKLGRLIWNQSFLDHIREQGMGEFLFTDATKPPEATAKLAADKSEVYAPLNGLWTTPEINQAFKDALGKEQMANWYRTIVQYNGLLKYGKTVLSPTTAARNWLANFLIATANGHWDVRQMSKSIAGLQEYFAKNGSEAKIAYLRRLKELGVIYDTPYAGEILRLLEESKLPGLLSGQGYDGGAIKGAMDFATKFYQYGDDFWKIAGFENEKNLLKSVGFSTEEAEVKAAERIRNTYPTYSMVGRAMQYLRRFPLVGTFVSWPSEVIRTSSNILRYAVSDMKDPRLRKLAKRRWAGIVVAGAFTHALSALSMAWLGMDDEDDEAVRLMAAPWQRNSKFFYMGRDEDGLLRYFDMSYLDPYNLLKRPLVAIMRNQPWQEKAKDAITELLEPFLGVDMAAKTIFEVLANKKESGGEVYKDYDTTPNQIVDIANHLRKTAQPGIASNLERTWKALDGQYSPSGRKYSLQDEAAAWVGFRMSTLDPKVALYYRSFGFKDARTDADKKAREALLDKDVSKSDIADAKRLNARLRKKAFHEMYLLVEAARQSGLVDSEIRSVLKNSKVSGDDINAIMLDDVNYYTPKRETINEQKKKAQRLLGEDAALDVEQNYLDYNRTSFLDVVGAGS